MKSEKYKNLKSVEDLFLFENTVLKNGKLSVQGGLVSTCVEIFNKVMNDQEEEKRIEGFASRLYDTTDEYVKLLQEKIDICNEFKESLKQDFSLDKKLDVKKIAKFKR